MEATRRLHRYLVPRLLVVLFYAAYVYILRAEDDTWELHHYVVAWIASLYCCFDHVFSIICLAACTGVYVQGLAAYGPALLSQSSAAYAS